MKFGSFGVLSHSRAVAAVTLFALVACSDSTQPTAPAARGAEATTVILPTPTQVTVLTRTTPLAAPMSASKLVGIWGGTIVLPGVGLSVIVPPLALSSATTITVTAVAGSQVAYEFAPHGTTFNVPLLVTQQLSGTNANAVGLSTLFAGYFADLSDLSPLTGTAWINELLGVSLAPGGTSATFGVTHFSGYLLGSGRSAEGEGEGLR